MADDREIFDKAESDMRLLQSRLQLTSPELLTIFLIVVAKDLSVPLPGAFDGLATNYAAILNPSGGGLNDEKLAINTYLGRVGTDLATFQYVLLTKIAQARAIANITPVISTPLPAAPYIPPAPKKPNPPPVLGLAVSLSAATTGTVGTAIALSATVAVPTGRAVTKVEFYEGSTKLGEDTTAPYAFSYTPGSIGNKAITARAFDDSPSPVVSVSNAVAIAVSAPSVPVPMVTVSAPGTANTNASVTLSATATITGDTIASVQFRVNGVNQGSADTSSPYSTTWTPTAAGTYSITAVATGTQGGTTTSAAVSVVVSVPTVPTPTVTVAAPKAGLINEAMTVTAAASVTGDTIASVQFQVNNTNSGAADTSSPYSTNVTQTVKGTIAVRAIATAAQGGTATSAAVNVPVFDTKVAGGASGAGTSLGAVGADFILFDNNQAAGGNAATMNIFVSSVQVAAFNYGDTAYNGRPFAFFNSANSTMYTGTIAGTVNF